MSATNNPLSIVDGDFSKIKVSRRRDEDGKYEYTIKCSCRFKGGGVRGRRAPRIVTKSESSRPDTVQILFNVTEDKRVKKELVNFKGKFRGLGIDDNNGTIEYYLVVHHPDGKSKNPPVKKPKGSAKTRTSNEGNNPI